MSEAKFEPGDGSGATEEQSPLTRFLISFETTLFHQGQRVKKAR